MRSLVLLSLCLGAAATPAQSPDESPAGPGEWGFRPSDGMDVDRNPPPFVVRPQRDAVRYRWQVARPGFDAEVVQTDTPYPAWRPRAPFDEGEWEWRFRFRTAEGAWSDWSGARGFAIDGDEPSVGMPTFEELLERLPDRHPRLFVRPEQRGELRELADGRLRTEFDRHRERCARILAELPDSTEPEKYPDGMQRGSEPWRELWWGNRKRTTLVLEPAAQLAFRSWLTGDEACREAARSLLMATAEWDPRGATGYRYNDEAGMPYAYWFARTYTFLHEALEPGERERCREVIRVRGREMYDHLAPGHLWRPYGSHANRAWHFLGELGVAFHGEIPEAERWLEFATTVMATVYPVWSDADGGWHEGLAYWRSYLDRFTWWADVVRAAFDVDVYREPFFSRVGDFAMYVQPPGTRGGGFGDLTARLGSRHHAELMARFARAAGDPHWKWYADQHELRPGPADFVELLRLAREPVEARAPDELPASKLFEGTGVAVLQTNLTGAKDNVQIVFKSSPFGSQSHGYEAQNSLLLNAFGERILIRSGRRDSYGSAHHRDWMWSTRSTNCVTVSGRGQSPHTVRAQGRVLEFATGDGWHYVEGEAGEAYEEGVESFRRAILLIEPNVVVVFDRLRTSEPETFTWWWHAEEEFGDAGERRYALAVGEARADLHLLWPERTEQAQTDAFDPPPRQRVKLVEHHLTSSTTEPAARAWGVTVVLVRRKGEDERAAPRLERVEGGFRLEVGGSTVLLRDLESAEASDGERRSTSSVTLFGADAQRRFASER